MDNKIIPQRHIDEIENARIEIHQLFDDLKILPPLVLSALWKLTHRKYINHPDLHSIETAPKDGRYILLAGPSGYTSVPLRFEVCRYDIEFRPLQPWVNCVGDSFLDGGGPPTHWLYLPET